MFVYLLTVCYGAMIMRQVVGPISVAEFTIEQLVLLITGGDSLANKQVVSSRIASSCLMVREPTPEMPDGGILRSTSTQANIQTGKPSVRRVFLAGNQGRASSERLLARCDENTRQVLKIDTERDEPPQADKGSATTAIRTAKRRSSR
jgi:hypothetical protein